MADGQTTVTGVVTYRQRSALPPGAIIEVTLADVSRADAPADILARQTITVTHQVPIPFALPYDPATIDQRARYSVRARITHADRLLFTTPTAYSVITHGAPTQVELLVEPVANALP